MTKTYPVLIHSKVEEKGQQMGFFVFYIASLVEPLKYGYKILVV